MKKILIISALLLAGLPAMSVCSISTGLCKADIMETPSLQDKLIPNNLENLQDLPSLKEINQLNDLRYNREMQSTEGTVAPSYDAACQFGACVGRPSLPSFGHGE